MMPLPLSEGFIDAAELRRDRLGILRGDRVPSSFDKRS
jgi:hypothetical protein